MKSWSADIKAKIEELSAILKPRGLHWWPKYLYHSTDVHNAASILETGYLYSRMEAKNRDLMIVDNASAEIIDKTRMNAMQYVRLYFQPRTPFQHNNEGIRPYGKRTHNAHCPIPIFLCFDAFQVLSMDMIKYSDGNMATRRAHCSDAQEFYLQIPFQHVFHEDPIPEDQKRDIKFHRHAEVLVPNLLPLENNLKLIVCRSGAELQTLNALLSKKAANKWQNNFRLDTKNRLFFRKWTFVSSVHASAGKLIFQFNPNTTTPGPFTAKITYIEKGKSPKGRRREIKEAKEDLELNVGDAKEGIVILQLDDSLAFKGQVNFERKIV